MASVICLPCCQHFPVAWEFLGSPAMAVERRKPDNQCVCTLRGRQLAGDQLWCICYSTFKPYRFCLPVSRAKCTSRRKQEVKRERIILRYAENSRIFFLWGKTCEIIQLKTKHLMTLVHRKADFTGCCLEKFLFLLLLNHISRFFFWLLLHLE